MRDRFGKIIQDNREEQEDSDHKKIEIRLDGIDESPTDPKAQRLKSFANIIATSAALIGAVAALYRPQDQTINKNTYEQLKTEIEHTNADVKQNHDDMVALHNFLLGYFAGDSFSLPQLSTPKVISLSVDAGIPTSTPHPKPETNSVPLNVRTIPTISSISTKDAGAGTITFVIPPAAQSKPLPELHRPENARSIPSFEYITEKSKK